MLLGDQGAIAIVVGEVDVGLLLDARVEPPIVNTEGNKIDFLTLDGAGLNALVLFLDVGGKLRTVVTAVGLDSVSVKERNERFSIQIALPL